MHGCGCVCTFAEVSEYVCVSDCMCVLGVGVTAVVCSFPYEFRAAYGKMVSPMCVASVALYTFVQLALCTHACAHIRAGI